MSRDGDLADTLTDIACRLALLVESVVADWPDRRGADWAERAARLQRELVQQADAAAELGERSEPGTAQPAAAPSAAGGMATGGMRVRPGIRLGGVDGHRVDDEQGIRIAELPPP